MLIAYRGGASSSGRMERLTEAAMAARDVPAGESWAFREHRTTAEVLAGGTATA